MAGIVEYLEKIFANENLSFDEAKSLQDMIFNGEVDPAQVAAFLSAMRCKRVSVDELAGLAASLREHSVKVETGLDELVDTCGTGGAKVKTFNISTASAIVSAAAGAKIAKHGNRGITSKCGSADVLEALGVNIECGPEVSADCIKGAGVGFIFAPKFHPAMKYVQPVRKALGFRTIFNFLGPLANPARAKRQVIGVADKGMMQRVVEALKILGLERAMVVHSSGLDEISTMGATKILELKDGDISAYELDTSDYGIERAEYDDLKGGDAQENAAIIKAIFSSEETGPKRDIVVANSAAAIMVAGIAKDYNEALELAKTAIDDKKALQTLEKLVDISNSKEA